jgi:predicted peroxiredoxin
MEALVRFLYLVTKGANDPTLASVPLHLAVNGSAEVGHDTQILLVGEGVEVAIANKGQGIAGLGVPPMAELLSKLKDHEIPVFV